VGRLRRSIPASVATLALALSLAAPAVLAGGGFSNLEADATFGVDMTFSASWAGTADHVELLLGFGGEDRLVVPITPSGDELSYQRDMAEDYLPPNTTVTYQWRAVTGDRATLSTEQTLLYDDDRSHLDWEQDEIGSATVHWYGGNETIARRFGDLAGDAADAAGVLLGRPLADPISIFVYEAREDFLGAIGPGSREWIGAATFPNIRTVFMWLEAGSEAYLETTLAHEVTHVVFADASANPFHDPATWLNEGTAVWSEVGNAETEADIVEQEARIGGLMAFEALTDQFPIDTRGATLAYAQGATMVDHILATYGDDALAAIMDAYRDGATDAEAIEDGTGTPFDEIRADYFASFGTTEPEPIEPVELGDSDVPLPGGGTGTGPSSAADPGPAEPDETPDVVWWLIIGLVLIGVVFVGTVAWRARRAGSPPAEPPQAPPAEPPAPPPAPPGGGDA
jgi:hypothetical protein